MFLLSHYYNSHLIFLVLFQSNYNLVILMLIRETVYRKVNDLHTDSYALSV